MKIRTFGIALVAAAGLVLAGAGAATAEETPATGAGSAEALPALLELLSSGSSEAPAGEVADETPVDTGSAQLLPALLELLSSGSSAAPGETPAP
ncbi:hypothetical protein [Nocardia farcinica]|uniref:hypothetical protein n=1 Tax=Nocardia farcinica TaxID=37329 RepID=UPI00245374B9|nr:hypothetical protein [Nocardia farcinica]